MSCLRTIASYPIAAIVPEEVTVTMLFQWLDSVYTAKGS